MPRGNTHILAKAIAYFLNNAGDAARMGAALNQTVRTQFSKERMLEKTLVLY